jgi:hypothetical protein
LYHNCWSTLIFRLGVQTHEITLMI